MKRLESLKRKLTANKDLHVEYTKFMNTILERDDAEETVGGEDQEWYLPHHGVFHPKKKKLRVVFDCSATYKGTSLNAHLLTGPNLINDLTGVFARFRSGEVAFTTDVEKMFHQFRVENDDRRYLKFLWWKNGDLNTEPTTYRMNVHLFGAASSPGCANYGLKYLASSNEETHPEAAHFIKRNFYVDDGLGSVDSTEKAIEIIKSATEICREGGLRLHKFASNSERVLEAVPESERSDTTSVKNLSLSTPDIENERTLGMEWRVNDDTLRFSNIETTAPATRRGMLSTVASLYDPMGLIAPFTLKGKSILQEACKKGSKWDEPVEEPTLMKWQEWIKELAGLDQIYIDRCYKPRGFGKVMTTELHHFADASQSGYGMCSYLRFVNAERDVHCALVAAKARVAPMKAVSIPRLELTAAVVAAEIGSSIKAQLDMEISQEFFWTDSQVVLGYINNDVKRFHTFVANRIQRIKDITEPQQWRHVTTDSNPADHASRGLALTQLKESNWFTGPRWLWDSELSIAPHVIPSLEPQDPEVRICLSSSTKRPEDFDLNERLKHISSWEKARAIVARLRRVVNREKGNDLLKPEELQIAERTILQNVQQQYLSEEYIQCAQGKSLVQKHPLYKADLFLHDGLLRAGGRIQNEILPIEQRNPVILPKCHITDLIIAHCHNAIKHQGINFTLNEIRSNGFWVIGGYQVVAKTIRNCTTCNRLRGKPVEQRMADLPDERVEASPPFTHVGMDCFGPLMTKSGRKVFKRYGLLFTCMCSRAVHLEMLDDLTTDAFINGLRCMIAIRGPVQKIFCDQGTNFVGANNELNRELKTQLPTSFKECEFIFNAPHASHAGGLWERQVRTVKNVLTAITEMKSVKDRLDDASLRTFLYETMAIVNSRPLTAIRTGDPTSPEPLTPNHVITMKSKVPSPPPGHFVEQDAYLRKRWRRVQYMLEQFWSRWRSEYVSNINKRQKWLKDRVNLQPGDMMLIVDENLPRNEWKLGRIVDTFPGKDQLVRRVRLQVSTRDLDAKGRRSQEPTFLERPVQKFILILPHSPDPHGPTPAAT